MKDYMYELIKESILSIEEKVTKDIYVISLFVYDLEDDPRFPTVTLGYNTNKNYKQSIKEAYDEAEAKWNYAYYLQNELLVIGVENNEQELITNWIKELNLYFSDQKLNENFEKAMILGEEITKQFIKILIEIVKKLHSDGIIKQKFKKEIPVLIHELEYYDEIAHQNKLANPLITVNEFIDWINNM